MLKARLRRADSLVERRQGVEVFSSGAEKRQLLFSGKLASNTYLPDLEETVIRQICK